MPSNTLSRQQAMQAYKRFVLPQLQECSRELNGTHVVCYYSDFLNKPINSGICEDDLRGLVRAFKRNNNGGPLALILHTPGGNFEATDMIVEYIHSEFNHVTAIVPHTAMSGGTSIALSCNKILIGAAGALGPIDPQILDRASNTSAAAKDILSRSLHLPSDEWDKFSLFHKARRLSEMSIRFTENMLTRKGKQLTAILKITHAFHIAPTSHNERFSFAKIDGLKLDLDVEKLETNKALNLAAISTIGYLRAITSLTYINRVILSNLWAGGIF